MDAQVGVSKCRGFTLLELLVTLSIAAILLAVGVPSYVTFIDNNLSPLKPMICSIVSIWRAVRRLNVALRYAWSRLLAATGVAVLLVLLSRLGIGIRH